MNRYPLVFIPDNPGFEFNRLCSVMVGHNKNKSGIFAGHKLHPGFYERPGGTDIKGFGLDDFPADHRIDFQ